MRFDVAVRERAESAFSQLAQSAIGAVLINVSRDSIDEALSLVRELRRGGSRSPIALVTTFTLRSHDRARALRAGADDFFLALHPEEFLLRVEVLVQRGRSSAIVSPEPSVTMPESADGTGILDESAFRDAVQAHCAADALAFFTLVRLAPTDEGADAEQLATLGRDQIRREGGDFVGRFDGAVTVYLHSARRKDVEPFTRRMRDAWRAAGHGELEITTAAYPSEEAAMQAMLGALTA
jgi:CheY-like chemotaxis protein